MHFLLNFEFYHCCRLRLVWLEKVAICKKPGTSWIASLWSLGKIHAIVYHIGLWPIQNITVQWENFDPCSLMKWKCLVS